MQALAATSCGDQGLEDRAFFVAFGQSPYLINSLCKTMIAAQERRPHPIQVIGLLEPCPIRLPLAILEKMLGCLAKQLLLRHPRHDREAVRFDAKRPRHV